MDIEARIRQGFEKQGFMHTLGAELASIAAGAVSIRVAYRPELTQQHGLFHGGVIATLADNAAGFAAYSLMQDGEQPLSIEFKISFLEAGIGDFIEARGRVIRAGRKIKHCQVDVLALSDGGEKLIATALATISTSRSIEETL